jgi:hypothetical protein
VCVCVCVCTHKRARAHTHTHTHTHTHKVNSNSYKNRIDITCTKQFLDYRPVKRWKPGPALGKNYCVYTHIHTLLHTKRISHKAAFAFFCFNSLLKLYKFYIQFHLRLFFQISNLCMQIHTFFQWLFIFLSHLLLSLFCIIFCDTPKFYIAAVFITGFQFTFLFQFLRFQIEGGGIK